MAPRWPLIANSAFLWCYNWHSDTFQNNPEMTPNLWPVSGLWIPLPQSSMVFEDSTSLLRPCWCNSACGSVISRRAGCVGVRPSPGSWTTCGSVSGRRHPIPAMRSLQITGLDRNRQFKATISLPFAFGTDQGRHDNVNPFHIANHYFHFPFSACFYLWL